MPAPPRYEVPSSSSPLKQGEILGEIWEHRPRKPPIELPKGTSTPISSTLHPLMVVMNPACDLEWDFKARFPDGQVEGQHQVDERDPVYVPYVFLCDVYEESRIRPLIKGSDIWKRIWQNQDERYHHFEPAPIGDPPIGELKDLYLDFKKTLALPTASLYKGLHSGGVKRVAVVPPIYIHDLMHRFYGFLSRVGLPE